jgi:hypothetical protein
MRTSRCCLSSSMYVPLPSLHQSACATTVSPQVSMCHCCLCTGKHAPLCVFLTIRQVQPASMCHAVSAPVMHAPLCCLNQYARASAVSAPASMRHSGFSTSQHVPLASLHQSACTTTVSPQVSMCPCCLCTS